MSHDAVNVHHHDDHAHGHPPTTTGVDSRKMAMWVLIGSECFLFATLIVNYMINRHRALSGPKPAEIYNIDITTWSTFDLLMSSVAMVLALHYCREKALNKFRFWLAMTALGGLIFLGFQYYEFNHFVHNGLSLSTSVFGSSFFMLTGCHGLHVAVGTLWLTSMLINSLRKGDKWHDPEIVEVAGLYWHFVDVVWIVIFTVVYLFVYV